MIFVLTAFSLVLPQVPGDALVERYPSGFTIRSSQFPGQGETRERGR